MTAYGTEPVMEANMDRLWPNRHCTYNRLRASSHLQATTSNHFHDPFMRLWRHYAGPKTCTCDPGSKALNTTNPDSANAEFCAKIRIPKTVSENSNAILVVSEMWRFWTFFLFQSHHVNLTSTVKKKSGIEHQWYYCSMTGKCKFPKSTSAASHYLSEVDDKHLWLILELTRFILMTLEALTLFCFSFFFSPVIFFYGVGVVCKNLTKTRSQFSFSAFLKGKTSHIPQD